MSLALAFCVTWIAHAGRAQSISSISPTSTPMSSQFTLSITGSGFGSCAQFPNLVNSVVVGGQSFGIPGCNPSTTQISISIPAFATTTPGPVIVQVAVYSAATGLTSYSNAATLSITPVAPIISSLSPPSASAGGPSMNLTIYGTHVLGNGWFGGVTFNGSFVSTVGGDGLSGGYVIAAIPATLIQSPGPVLVWLSTLGGVSNSVTFNVTPLIPSIASISPPSMMPLLPSSGPVSVTINGTNFVPTSLAYANGSPLNTTYLSPSQMTADIDPSLPQAQLPGGIAITVESTAAQVSNALALVVGGGANAGTIVRSPRDASPGSAFAFRVEGGIPGAPLTLAVDLGTPSVIAGWPTPAANMVLAVGTGAAMLVPLCDGLGVFGTPDGTAFSSSPSGTPPGGVYVLGGLVAPNPALGIGIVIQAVYTDASSPTGYRLTWARFPDPI